MHKYEGWQISVSTETNLSNCAKSNLVFKYHQNFASFSFGIQSDIKSVSHKWWKKSKIKSCIYIESHNQVYCEEFIQERR